MKILQVSKEARLGGAGIAAYRLHKGLRSLGVDSTMLVNKADQPEDHVIVPSNTVDKVIARLSPLLDQIPGRLLGQTSERVSASLVPDRLPRRISALQPDILNLHWMNDGFMRIETLPRLRQPVVWTLHDMWPFAGGEHYVGDSIRYKEGYSSLNRPAFEKGFDINRWIWQRKKKSWSKLNNLVIVTPSKWLARCASESALFGHLRIEVLPNGVDHDRFHPMGHSVARRILGLPEDKKLILFGAGAATKDSRKGFHLLVDALKYLMDKTDCGDHELVVFGSSSGDDLPSMKTHYMGRLNDEISIALVYAAADVFVAPSLEDNLPNTVLESLSCGTPVLAFDIGGMPDMISHKNNGYLVADFDTQELAAGIRWLLDNPQRWRTLSENARDTVVKRFTSEQSAIRYLELYEGML